MRIEPDRLQAVAHLGLAQIFEVDSKALAIGELRVIFALPGKVGIDLDTVTDVADDDERRPAVRWRQGAGVFFRLSLGVEHKHVPSAPGTGLAAIRHIALGRKKIALPGDRLCRRPSSGFA